MEERISYFDRPTQVAFKEKEEVCDYPTWIGGIAFHDIIICGECGHTVLLEDVEEIRVLPWVSISEEIKGDNYFEDEEEEEE